MQEDNHIFQGLRRDNHQIRQDAKFLWDAHNIRLTNREDSTLLSLTNEKGTSNELITFQGYYVGHCVLGKYLIVFTANDDGSDNYIYRVEKTDSGYKTIILFYEAEAWEGSWNPNNPIEALGVYETELVQKVYWVDGINQPRVINIAKPELKLPATIDVNGTKQPLLIDRVNLSGPNYSSDPNVDLYLSNNYPNGLYLKDSFNFVRNLQLQEKVEVIRQESNGEFSPGTILYAFSYYNKYELESNICLTTPLYYISHDDRGEKSDEKVSNSFKILISNLDSNFEYIRIYSLHRTTIDAVPTVKVVIDIPINSSNNRITNNRISLNPETLLEGTIITYEDTGTTGYTIDDTQLLYIGGTPINVGTISQKDNTLFLGNIGLELQLFEKIKDIILRSCDTKNLKSISTIIDMNLSQNSVYYYYNNNLDSKYSAGFKTGESYRCGVQVQYKNGKWSEPIFIKDDRLCDMYPWNTLPNRHTKAVKLTLDTNTYNSLINYGVRKIRTCVVFPKASEREVICQGLLCPTVYSVAGRKNDSPYAMSSWFFRPTMNPKYLTNSDSSGNALNLYHGSSILFQHNKALLSGRNRGAEIQNMLEPEENAENWDVSNITEGNIDKYLSHYFVDENIVTFHSPDLEFDTSLSNYSWEDVALRIVGVASLGAISGDIDVKTSTPPLDSDSPGFTHSLVGYQTKNKYNINGGLVMTPFYRDRSRPLAPETKTGPEYWPVYPWHRSGSLNNDTRSDGTRTAVLLKKKISNLKFFDKNLGLGEDKPIYIDISTPQLFSSNELLMLKVTPYYLNKTVPYLGNVDTLSTSEAYPIYHSISAVYKFEPLTKDSGLVYESSDPVRIKYKSSPHLVFSLGGGTVNNRNKIVLLPIYTGISSIPGSSITGEFLFPTWQQTGSSDGSNNDKGVYSGILKYYGKKLSHGGMMDRPSKEDLGKYAFYHLTVYKAELYSFRKWEAMSGINGLILKVVGGETIAYQKLPSPKGEEVEDDSNNYKDNVYIGEDRYYKLVSVNSANRNYNLLYIKKEDIPNSGSSSPVYTIERDGFGKGLKLDAPYMLIGELIRKRISNKFGGDTEEAKRQNLWFPSGDPIAISEGETLVPFEYGDTWYSRYDCLKTYPFTQEDENQIVEIGSFMCETRINIDGRTDRNRGQLSNLNMTPLNFNLFNEVYSQKDNFFNYRILDKDYYKLDVFSNLITWSKEKHAGEDIDTWTNITLANTLDMDGEKGKVTALRTSNEYLLCFQEKALSQILFNSRVQIPTTDGVPIEISNGYKVDGSRLLNDNIGCSNKWSIINTAAGIYFLDSNTDSLYIFNGQLANLSEDRGMDWWVRQNHTDKIWNPIYYRSEALNGVRAFYDSKYGDIYFTPGPVEGIDQPDALCYSEQLGQFTSLMSYGGTQAMFNFADGFYSLRETDGNVKLYQNNVGDYNDFYGSVKGWDFSFISNENPTITKIFDTIETRADSFDGSTVIGDEYSTKKQPGQPFNFIRVSNEYQDTRWYDEEGKPKDIVFNSSNLRKKFRVWRALLPRNYGTRQRIRNPWSMITLGWNPLNTTQPGDNTKKAVVHDVSVKYTI